MIYDGGNPGLGLEQTQTCGRVKPLTVIPTVPSWQLRVSRIVIGLTYLHIKHEHALRNLLETNKHMHIIVTIISEKHTNIDSYHSLKYGHLVNDIKIDKSHV